MNGFQLLQELHQDLEALAPITPDTYRGRAQIKKVVVNNTLYYQAFYHGAYSGKVKSHPKATLEEALDYVEQKESWEERCIDWASDVDFWPGQ